MNSTCCCVCGCCPEGAHLSAVARVALLARYNVDGDEIGRVFIIDVNVCLMANGLLSFQARLLLVQLGVIVAVLLLLGLLGD